MKSKKNDLQSIFSAIIVLILLGIIAWFLFSEVGKAPWSFIAISAGVLGALTGSFITAQNNLNIQIRNEQIPKKVELYEKVINLFLGTLLNKKIYGTQKSSEELAKDIYEFTPDLITWASDDVLNLYIQLRQAGNNEIKDSSDTPASLFGQILLAIRKDLGHKNNQLNQDSILGIFVNDINSSSLENVKEST